MFGFISRIDLKHGRHCPTRPRYRAYKEKEQYSRDSSFCAHGSGELVLDAGKLLRNSLYLSSPLLLVLRRTFPWRMFPWLVVVRMLWTTSRWRSFVTSEVGAITELIKLIAKMKRVLEKKAGDARCVLRSCVCARASRFGNIDTCTREIDTCTKEIGT